MNFKSSVSLKRFNKKYTKFKRKALNRIKHINNWAIYHNIFKYWSKDYCFFRKIAQRQFYVNLFFKNYLFYNFTFNRNSLIPINDWNFIFYNFSKEKNLYNKNLRITYLNIFNYKNYIYNLKLQKLSFLSSAQSNNDLLLNSSSVLFFLTDQRYLFKSLNNDSLSQQSLFKSFLFTFYNIFFILKIKLLLNYYKTIIKFLFFVK